MDAVTSTTSLDYAKAYFVNQINYWIYMVSDMVL